MEEGLKVILSADVTQFQEAFTRAAQTTKQKVTEINQTLSSTGKGAEIAAKSFEQFVGQRMGAALKQFGSQGGAIRAIAAEWAVYSQAVGQAGNSGRGIEGTAQAVQKVAAAMGLLKTVDLPSAAPLVNSLNSAEAALKKLGAGTVSVRELNNAIAQLITAKSGLADTATIDTLIAKLQALAATGQGMRTIGLDINPNVDVAGTLKDIDKIKSLVAGQDFHFTLTADNKSLRGTMAQSVESTRAAVAQINTALQGAGTGFGQLTEKAKLSVAEYVRAVGQLNNVPTALKTTVQAPDIQPVLEAVRKVKSEIATATVTALPKLTLSADTSAFQQNLLQTKSVTQETWAQLRQTFSGVDKAISDAAAKSRVSVQQLIQNFNALKGAGPNAVVTQVVPPNFAPVVAAAKTARKDIEKTFLTPLPTLQLSSTLPQVQKQFASTTAVGQQFNQLLREMPNFAIDARIGVMSLSNNLPYFIDALNDAKKQGQGFPAIMKTLGSSMFSVGGIAMIAVTAFTYFAGSFNKTKDKASQLRSELDKARQASEDFVESLELIAKTRLKGEMNAQSELNTLKLLYDASQNQNLSYAERKKAVDALQAQYPAYFKNLSDETILAGDAKKAYDELALSILRASKAKAAKEELDELTKQERQIRKERALTGQAAIDAAQDLKRAQDASNKSQSSSASMGFAAVGYTKDVEARQRQYNTQLEKSNQLFGKLNKNLADQKKLAEEITSLGADKLVTDPTQGLKTPKEKNKKFEFLEEWLDFNPNSANITAEQKQKLVDVINRYSDQFGQILEGANFRALPGDNNKMIEAARKWWEDFQNGFIRLAPRKIDVDFSQIPVVPAGDVPTDIKMPITLTFTPEQIKANAVQDAINNVVNNWRDIFKDADLKFPPIDYSKFKDPKELNDYLKSLRDFGTAARDILSAAASDAVSGFAEGIGRALTGENFGDAFGNLVAVLGNAVMELGKQMISASAIMLAFQKVLRSLVSNPAAGLAVGAAMVAVGAAIKASAGKVMKFADGGIISGPTLGLMGEYAGAKSNPEVVAPLSKLKDMIKGTVGGGNMHLSGNFRVAGTDLVLALERTNRSQRRTF